MLNNTQWGPPTWKVIHTFAVLIPSSALMVEFIKVLKLILPCEACRNHFSTNGKKYPIENYVQDNETLFYWTYIMHNNVPGGAVSTVSPRTYFNMYRNEYYTTPSYLHDAIWIHVQSIAQGYPLIPTKEDKTLYIKYFTLLSKILSSLPSPEKCPAPAPTLSFSPPYSALLSRNTLMSWVQTEEEKYAHPPKN